LPDGRWLSYASDETGTIEIYVRPFPGPGSKSQITIGYGRFPKWSRIGRKLFFIGSGQRIMVAD
jgi:Tol biopolymer transport system component